MPAVLAISLNLMRRSKEELNQLLGGPVITQRLE